MIEFKGTGFTYDGERFVLDGVDARIERGEFVCVLGGNGSGKSTLAKHVNALLVPDEGSVTVLDRDTRDERSTYFIRSNAGMVFQNPDDQLVASLIENDVAFGPENLGVPTDQLRQRVADALADVGLQGFDKRETAALCRELHDRGMTVVMITHFMEEAAQADRVIVLEDGHVACDGAPQDVLVQAELLERLNLDLPLAAELSLELQRRGVPVGMHIETTTLKEELCRLLSKA